MRRAAWLLLALAGCGYRFAHAPSDPLGPFVVGGGRVLVPDAAALGAAEDGARAELSRASALSAGGEGSRVEIEILRVDEEGEGLSARGGSPFARGVRLTVVGRGRIRGLDGAVARETGDVRVTEVAARGETAAQGVWVSDEATRAASRRLGEVVVRKLLGVPEPGDP